MEVDLGPQRLKRKLGNPVGVEETGKKLKNLSGKQVVECLGAEVLKEHGLENVDDTKRVKSVARFMLGFDDIETQELLTDSSAIRSFLRWPEW